MYSEIINKCKLFGLIIVLITVVNIKISLGRINDINPQINNAYIPLELTLNKLGFDSIERNKDFISFVKNDKKINFVNEENYNLKKDDNTYYSTVLNEIYFIKIGVLKDLGYNIDDNYCINDGKNKFILDIEYFLKFFQLCSQEIDLSPSTSYYNHKILKRNIDISELTNYTIESNNLMGYDLSTLESYIKANYKMTITEYKKNLISIDIKYPSALKITYDLLDNGQIITTILDSNQKKYIEFAMEIRDKIIFVER